MSYSTTVSCTCERCGTTFEGTIWKSINADVDPELRDKLIHWGLMKFTCSGCGLEAHVPYDLLYHDMKRKFMIWLIHSDSEREKKYTEPLDEEFQMMERYKFRLVGTYFQLLEKIYIFESALDDIAIELNKTTILERGIFGNTDLQPENIFYSHLNDNNDLAFALIREGQEIQTRWLQRRIYLDELDNLNKYLSEMDAKDPCWLIVDHNFSRTFKETWLARQSRPQPKRPGLLEKLRRGW